MKPTKSLSIKARIIMLILIGLFSVRAIAQQTINAEAIMYEIQDGNDISYENVKIVGDLDFTYMEEKIPDLPRKYKWFNSGDNEVNEKIEVNIYFINCTFDGDVLAYIHDDPSGYTFTADFEKDVIFENCEFRRNAMFKYSEFEREASFEGSKFRKASTFKYAEFEEFTSFATTTFNDDAIFKYAEFDRGVSFERAVFEESLNIKYLEVRGDFNVDQMKVDDDIDSKYTKINGKGFSSYLLSSKN